MNDQPLLTPDESRVYCAVLLLEPTTENALVARMNPMLPVNKIHSALIYLSERRLIVQTSGIGHHPYWVTSKSWGNIYPYIERILHPILDENRILAARDQEQKDIAARYLDELRKWQARFGCLSPDDIGNIEVVNEDNKA